MKRVLLLGSCLGNIAFLNNNNNNNNKNILHFVLDLFFLYQPWLDRAGHLALGVCCKKVSVLCCLYFPVWCLGWEFRYEPRREKTGLRDFPPGPTQTELYKHRR